MRYISQIEHDNLTIHHDALHLTYRPRPPDNTPRCVTFHISNTTTRQHTTMRYISHIEHDHLTTHHDALHLIEHDHRHDALHLTEHDHLTTRHDALHFTYRTHHDNTPRCVTSHIEHDHRTGPSGSSHIEHPTPDNTPRCVTSHISTTTHTTALHTYHTTLHLTYRTRPPDNTPRYVTSHISTTTT